MIQKLQNLQDTLPSSLFYGYGKISKGNRWEQKQRKLLFMWAALSTAAFVDAVGVVRPTKAQIDQGEKTLSSAQTSEGSRDVRISDLEWLNS